jgi:ppGpp synthetase/RelA/SpoT-type nucleotidyltranferase
VAGELSATQVRNLGERLRKADAPTDEDRALLHQVLLAHEAPMLEVARVLREDLGLEATHRLKTQGTLIDKLKREKSNLAKVDDIAGVRLPPVADRVEQDEVVARIVERFPDHEVKDRRVDDSHGYRAVHVIVRVDGRRVEVQIRTKFQDAWAQIVERFADSVGRGIRYGDAPPAEDAANFADAMKSLAEYIDAFEDSEAITRRMETWLGDRDGVPLEIIERSPPQTFVFKRLHGKPRVTGQQLLDAYRDDDERHRTQVERLLDLARRETEERAQN